MILDVIRREHSRRSFQAVVPRPYGAAVGENMYFGTAGSHARRWRKRPVSTHVDRARRNGAAALQSSLGPAAPPRPVHVVAPARTRGVPSSLDVGGAPSGRLGRGTWGPVAPKPVPSGTGRIGGGCTRSDHDVGTSARRHGRQRAAADVRRALARLATRAGRSQEASWNSTRACRARRRAGADRLVPLLRTGRLDGRSRPDCSQERVVRPRAAAVPRRCLATWRGGGAGRLDPRYVQELSD